MTSVLLAQVASTPSSSKHRHWKDSPRTSFLPPVARFPADQLSGFGDQLFGFTLWVTLDLLRGPEGSLGRLEPSFAGNGAPLYIVPWRFQVWRDVVLGSAIF